MKPTLSIIFLLFSLCAKAQTLSELQKALKSSDKAVQAIHGYPAHIDNGKCHWVPVTNLVLTGNDLTITETWHGPMGLSTTVLTAKMINGSAKGVWASGFSSGTWSYSFIGSKGQWNKTKSVAETFDDEYSLKFRIVDKKDVKDGPYDCN